MEWRIGSATLRFLRGDITEQEVDAIVNAANSDLAGGGGVDGAIHRVGGPSILAECRKIRGCPTGSAVATGAGLLRAKAVIHAVGPIWVGGLRSEPASLASAYRRSLEIAAERGFVSIAFPSISTGSYRYPVAPAARIALSTVRDYLTSQPSTVRDVRFVLFRDADLLTYEEAAREVLAGP